MERLIYLFLFFCLFKANAQAFDYGIGFNYKLFLQLGKNQTVRVGSEKLYQNNFKEQRKLYDNVNKNLVQVIVVHDHIYKQLSNVHSALKQGKKLEYFYQYIGKISKNTKKMLVLSKKNPQYAILFTKTYNQLLKEGTTLIQEVNNTILKEGNDFLIDPYDREIIIEKMLDKARMINGYLLLLINKLEIANKIAYIKQIPILKNYYSLDKTIVEHIINQWKNIKL